MPILRAKVLAFFLWLKAQEVMFEMAHKILFGCATLFMFYTILGAFAEPDNSMHMSIEGRLSKLEAEHIAVMRQLEVVGITQAAHLVRSDQGFERIAGLEHDVAIGKQVGMGTLCGVFMLMLETLARLVSGKRKI